jgi:hypothetical protein
MMSYIIIQTLKRSMSCLLCILVVPLLNKELNFSCLTLDILLETKSETFTVYSPISLRK